VPYVKASLLALFVVFGSLRCNEGAADTPPAAPSKAAPAIGKHAEERIRDTLATGVIERVEKGSGGRSLGFKLTFSGGVQGYFKPEQTFGANWNSEAAAYYVDRELGLGRVPPAVGRRIDWQELRSHAGKDRRLEEIVVRQGSVRGSVVWWVPEELAPVDLPADWLGWLRVDRRFGASPFQTARDYWRDRKARRPTRLLDPPAPSFADRPAELSDLILFDYLIGNADRWGSDNVNVQVLAGSRRLIYLDNANGFELLQKPNKLLEARLAAVQRFRRTTVEAIRTLDVKELEQHMKSDPLAPLLSEAQLAALERRRQRVIEHVTEVERQFGASALPW